MNGQILNVYSLTLTILSALPATATLTTPLSLLRQLPLGLLLTGGLLLAAARVPRMRRVFGGVVG